ncbi:50S ribosomal protein L22 [Candidatus Parcubacteria bacterium]|nr:50S ribosomal protein L22 [Candidatus Parcubacteria bacterium]
MEIKAKVKNIKNSPRKVRLVVDVVRGLKVGDALNQLRFVNKKAVISVTKLLKSAIANATNNFELDESNLFVKEIKVDEGATMKRWMPRARGRATPLRKRTSHINIVLGELVDSGKKEAKKQELEAPVKLDEMAGGTDTKKTGKKKEDTKKIKGQKSEKGTSGKIFQRKVG